MTALTRKQRWMFGAFAVGQAVILVLPVSATTASLMVAWFDVVIAVIALFGSAPLAAATAVALTVARTMFSLGISGLPLRMASMVHIDLFFLLVLVIIAGRQREDSDEHR